MSIALLEPHGLAAEIPRRGAAVNLGQAVAAVVAAKHSNGCRPAYVASLRQYLSAFSRGREHAPLHTITTDVIDDWFNRRNEPPVTRAGNLGRLAALFSFSVRRKWVPENPCDGIERIRVDRKPPAILSPLQCALVLDWCRRRKPNQAAFFALAMLAGIRPDEISRLDWGAINLEERTVTIDAAASKVRQRRIVDLEPSAAQWLAWARERGGRLPVKRMTRRRYLAQASKLLGFDAWPQDCLRHTAASFLLAKHKNAGQVALQLGNSIRILETHYKALVPAKQCAEFWSFTPDSPRPEKPKLDPPVFDPVRLPVVTTAIDPTLSRFARAELALQMEPLLRRLGRQKQQIAGYYGGVTGRRLDGDRIDTIGELGRLANCSRQTLQWCKHIIRLADPDVLEKLRAGHPKFSIAGVFKQVIGTG